jgi:tetratricopeptide (TPR) repeat protein
MAKGIQRRQLREPDEFLTLSRRFLEYAQQHEREVTMVVVGLVAITALALGVRTYRGWKESQAEAAFGAARRDFTASRYDTAAKGFEKVAATWPSTAHGQLALVYLGNSYADLGKRKEAEEAFARVLERASEPVVRQIAHYNLGVLKAEDGDKPAAARELGSAADAEGPLRGAAWFARLGSGDSFVEEVGPGMDAIGDLGPEARAYVDAQLAARAKSGAK